MREAVEAYFSQLRDIRASGAGVAETSYSSPLANLRDEVGKHLKPKVRAIINLRSDDDDRLAVPCRAGRA